MGKEKEKQKEQGSKEDKYEDRITVGIKRTGESIITPNGEKVPLAEAVVEIMLEAPKKGEHRSLGDLETELKGAAKGIFEEVLKKADKKPDGKPDGKLTIRDFFSTVPKELDLDILTKENLDVIVEDYLEKLKKADKDKDGNLTREEFENSSKPIKPTNLANQNQPLKDTKQEVS